MKTFFLQILSPLLIFFSGPATAPVPQIVPSNHFDISHLEQTVSNIDVRLHYLEDHLSTPLGASLPIPTSVALFETSLASKISSSATSMTLVSGTDKTGTSLASSTYAFIIDEGSPVEEMVIADCTNTTCTNIVRGVHPVTGTTTVVALEHEHRRGASVKITDGPQLLILSRILNGVGTLPNSLSYNGAKTPVVGQYNLPSWDYVKTYADNLAIAGAPDSSAITKGIVEKATGTEAANTAADGSGNTTAPLALTASIATSTCQTVAPYVIVASSTTGKLDKGCFDQTSTYNLTGAVTFSNATTTLSATSSIAASVSAKLSLNSFPYVFPSQAASSSDVLKNDGNGVLSWGKPSRYNLISQSSFSPPSIYATSTGLGIPAGVMTASSTIDVYGNAICSNASCTFQIVNQNGTPFVTCNALPGAASVEVSEFFHVSIYSNGNSVTSQMSNCTGVVIQDSGTISSANQRTDNGIGTSSFNLANAFTIYIVAKESTPDMTISNYSIVVNP